MSANLAYPLQQPSSAGTEYQALKFFVNSILSHVRTANPVEVVAVHGGGLGPIGTVDVQPLVSQVNGIGQGQPHGVVYGLPYVRWQGGTSAMILDPVVNDMGLLVCCDRDTSNVIATLAAALPGSLRRFNFADGIYVGCHLSETVPTDYVWIKPAGAGISIVSQGVITIQAPQINLAGAVNQTDGNVTFQTKLTVPNLDATTDVTVPNGSVNGHVHPYSGGTTGGMTG